MANTLISITNILTWITWSFPFIVLTLVSYDLELLTKYKTKWKLFLTALLCGIIYSAVKSYDYWKYSDTLLFHRLFADFILLFGTAIAAYASISMLRFKKISMGKTKGVSISLAFIGVSIPALAYFFGKLPFFIMVDVIAYNLSIVFLILVYLTIGKISRNYIPEYHNIAYTSARVGSILLLIDPILRSYYYIGGLDLAVKHAYRFSGTIFYFIASILLGFAAVMLIHEARIRGIHLTPRKEKTTTSVQQYRLKKGYAYLIKEIGPEKSFEIFIDHVSRKQYGLCITRNKPTEVREKFGLRTTPILWMSNAQTDEKSVKPTDLKRLMLIITDFIGEGTDCVILLQRLDYLIVQNSFKEVLKFIQALNDIIMEKRCVLLISINPETLNSNEFSLLYEELQDLGGADSVVLPEKSYSLLTFINSENNSNRLPSFIDVVGKFSITKTTARNRIRDLESKRLLRITKDGKYKLLEVTEQGKRILSSPVGPKGGE